MSAPSSSPVLISPPNGPGWHRLVAVALALAALVTAWFSLAAISRSDPWYRNTDMNMHNLIDALSINSGVPPNYVDQPGVPLKNLLALDYRLRHRLGLLPVWNLESFGASADPLREIPGLVRVGRLHSRMLVMLLILAAGGLAYAVTRQVDIACLAVVLLCGSSGLLFHGLLTRPELLCVGLGLVLAPLCLWLSLVSRPGPGHYLWLFLGGIFCGFAALDKLPGVCFLALGFGWCWVAAPGRAAESPAAPGDAPARPVLWGGLLSVAGGCAVLGLLWLLEDYQPDLGSVVTLRLRLAAVLVAALPFLGLWPVRHRVGRFLLERSRESAVLGGGALAALPLAYLLLRCALPEPAALKYLSAVLPVLVNPGLYMKVMLATKPDVGHEFVAFLRETPLLFLGASLLAASLGLRRTILPGLRAFLALLLAAALGLALLMSRRQFLAQYSIFPQVPLLLILALGIAAVRAGWPGIPPAAGRGLSLVALAAAFVLVLLAPARTRLKYTRFQDDLSLPVRELTLTFLFDHDSHTLAYRQIMKDHYGDRENFARILGQYLADPANRY